MRGRKYSLFRSTWSHIFWVDIDKDRKHHCHLYICMSCLNYIIWYNYINSQDTFGILVQVSLDSENTSLWTTVGLVSPSQMPYYPTKFYLERPWLCVWLGNTTKWGVIYKIIKGVIQEQKTTLTTYSHVLMLIVLCFLTINQTYQGLIFRF